MSQVPIEPSATPPATPSGGFSANSDNDQLDHAMLAAQAARKKRWLRIVLGIVGGVVLLLVAAVLLVWILFRSEPAFWTKNKAFLASKPPAELRRMAEDLERRIVHDVFNPDNVDDGTGTGPTTGGGTTNSGELTPDTPASPAPARHVRVSLDEMNAWLAVRAKQWAANRSVSIPEWVSEFAVGTEGDRLILGLKTKGSVEQVHSMTLGIHVPETGRATVHVASIHSGRLPVPLALVQRGAAMSAAPVSQERIASAFEGLEVEPVIHIDHQRRLRVLAFKTEPEGLDLTVRMEPRVPGAP